jgi:hypothetical protein
MMATKRHKSAVTKRRRAATKSRRRPQVTELRDAIRIVPVAAPKELFHHVAAVPAAPPPLLTYRGGPLLDTVKVYNLYIGSAWSTGHAKTVAAGLDAFFKFVLTSALIDQLAEYIVPKYTIGHGTFLGSKVLSSVIPPSSVTDAWMRTELKRAITAGGGVPKSGPNVLYFLYLPPGVALTQGGGKSCQAFCGYHDHINGKIFYAAMPYANCNGCLGGLSTLDALTSTSSHELCEAITDPVPGTGWYDDANGEIGDICAWETKKVGNHVVQKEWSNASRACG